MPQFSDDLFLGAAQTYMGTNTNNAENADDPSPMSLGVGPLGRIYVWDTVPLTKGAANIAAASAYTAAITLTAGTGVTSVIRNDGVTALQVDVPRALSITIGAGTITNRNVTITGYDYYGHPMSEVIATGTTQSTTVNGKKAFFQITAATVSGAVGATVSIGTADIFGAPVRFNNRGYLARVGWDNTLAENAATATVADATTATTTTGDVRGTVAPSTAADGAKRLVVAILLTAIQVGPNATRAGALGVNQNLVS
jgi:hypothetical protein